jgi:hypothetical protein
MIVETLKQEGQEDKSKQNEFGDDTNTLLSNLGIKIENGKTDTVKIEPKVEDILKKSETERTPDEVKLVEEHNTKIQQQEAEKKAKEVETKLEELKKKKPEELKDEDKQFIEANRKRSVIERLQEHYDFKLEDKNFENTTEGLLEFNDVLIETRAKEAAKEIIKSNPALAELVDHFIVKGGSAETFIEKKIVPDFAKIKTDTVEGQEQLVRLFYKEKGIDNSDIDLIINSSKKDDSLKDKASNAKKLLEENRQNQIKAKEQAEFDNAKKIKEDSQKVQQDITNTINKGKLLNVELSDADKKNLLNDIFTIDQEGVSQVERKFNALSLEEKMFINLLVSKNFQVKGLDIKKIISKQNLDDQFSENEKRAKIVAESTKQNPIKRDVDKTWLSDLLEKK